MNSRMRRIALGTLFAGAMGYIAGILTAPKSGSDTRESFRSARDGGMAEAERQLKRLYTELSNLIGEAEDKSEDKTEKKAGQTPSQHDTKSGATALEGEIVQMASRTRQKAREILSALHDGNADDRDLDKAVNEAAEAIKSIKSYLRK